MPNWCNNSVIVTGPNAEVAKVFDKIKDGSNLISFDKIVPYPDKFRQMDLDKTSLDEKAYKQKWGTDHNGYNSGGYEWCINNWGTKWKAAFASREGNELRFETAWSPPSAAIVQLHIQNPKVDLYHSFNEPGMCFAGSDYYLSKSSSKLGKDWKPGTAENSSYVEDSKYYEYVGMMPYDEDSDHVDQPVTSSGVLAGNVNEEIKMSTTETTTVTTTEVTTEVTEKKLSKREQMAAMTEQQVVTVMGLIDFDTDTGNMTANDQVMPATLLEGVTMDMMEKAQEQSIHTTNVVTAAATRMASNAYKINAGLKTTNLSAKTVGKDAIEINTDRNGDVLIRHKVVAVNDKAGALKTTVNSFRQAMMDMAKEEEASAASK